MAKVHIDRLVIRAPGTSKADAESLARELGARLGVELQGRFASNAGPNVALDRVEATVRGAHTSTTAAPRIADSVGLSVEHAVRGARSTRGD